jgi:hypothetical protein
MQRAIPGLQDADRAYAQAQGLIESQEIGKKMVSSARSAAEARRAMGAMSPAEADAMREGMILEWVRKLESKEGPDVGIAQTIMNAGSEMRDKLRIGFPDDATFLEFTELINTEQNAARLTAGLKRFIPFLLTATGGGAIGFGFGRAVTQ